MAPVDTDLLFKVFCNPVSANARYGDSVDVGPMLCSAVFL